MCAVILDESESIMKKHIRRNGFTLIELLIVIALLGMLIVAGVGSFISSVKKSRDSRRKSDLGQVAQALETYYNDKGKYPLGDSGLIKGCILGSGSASDCTWGQKWSDLSASPETIYMLALPTDPQPGEVYYYESADGSYYKIYSTIEDTMNTDKGVNIGGYAGTNCGGGAECMYGLASSNTPL